MLNCGNEHFCWMSCRRVTVRIAAVALIFVVALSCESDDLGVRLCKLTIGENTFSVEIADTPEVRAKGLMGREGIPKQGGMLFVFPEDRHLAFWMKDTTIPLSIAFIDSSGVIGEIHQMKPLSLRRVASSRAYRYALEVNQGRFAELGIMIGTTVSFGEGCSDAEER